MPGVFRQDHKDAVFSLFGLKKRSETLPSGSRTTGARVSNGIGR